ncbi:MAG: ribbon-helix-helix domain-containing protein [Actinomycetota bacterium]
MSVTLSIKIDEQLLKKLEAVAKEQGVSRSSLVRKGIELVLLREERLCRELVKEVSEALRDNKRVPVQVDWRRIDEELCKKAPKWKTLAEAMSATRKREWKE